LNGIGVTGAFAAVEACAVAVPSVLELHPARTRRRSAAAPAKALIVASSRVRVIRGWVRLMDYLRPRLAGF
jgi:hypothetical protein